MNYQLDLTAYRCPLPLLMAKKAVSTLAKGDCLQLLLASENGTSDLQCWCEHQSFSFQVKQENKRLVFEIFL